MVLLLLLLRLLLLLLFLLLLLLLRLLRLLQLESLLFELLRIFFGVGGRGRRPLESADPEGRGPRRVGQQGGLLLEKGLLKDNR